MNLTVKSAMIQFGQGQTVGMLIGFEYFDNGESLIGSIQVPLNKVGDMGYATLSKVVKEEMVERLSAELTETEETK